MAKKKTELSPEELLQQALVPENEQPYKVPDNWVWTRLGVLNEYNGKSIDPNNDPDSNFELYSVPSFESNYPEVISGSQIGSTKQCVLKNDILLCKINPRINRVWIVDQHTSNTTIASSEWIIIRNNFINSKYLMWCLRSNYFREYMLSNVSGVGGSLMRAQPKYVQDYPIPLAPLAEQQRIVDRIESLFEKLDQAKELIQNALDSNENRKAAVLHKAFTGELTEKWRGENGVGMESWIKTTLGKVCKSIYDGDHMPPPKSSDGIPFLVISNINKGVLSFDNTRFVSQAYFDGLSDSRKPMVGDVLYSIVGSYGIPALVDIELPFCFQRHIALFKPQSIDSKYLWYLLQTNDIYDKATKIATGTAQLTVPIKGLREIVFSLPSKHEQLEIVRILDDLFKNDQYAKEFCEVIEKIDLMKKSILSRAFRGELGTNNPMDLNVRELLNIINIK